MIIRYPGGKSKKSIKQKIASRFPKSFSEYRETMVGGGGIFFSIDKNKKRWINDIDQNLIAVYTALKEKKEEFIKRCRDINTKNVEELRNKFEELANDANSDPALRYFFINRTVWAGRVNYELKSRLYFSNPQGWNIINTKKLEQAADFLKDAKISYGDYEKMLLEDGDDVLIYIGPPYYLNTKLSKCSRLYRYNFEEEDHDRLFELVKNCKHKVVISYDDCPRIRKLYKDFNFGNGLGDSDVESFDFKYCGTSSAQNQSKTKRVGKELIISNF